MNIKQDFQDYISALQLKICTALEAVDNKERFKRDEWIRPEGGGGISCVLSGGNVFEKAGVSTSAVFGSLPITMQQALGTSENNFFACGLSLVIHPRNPYVPTVHANWRYFELYNEALAKIDSWFGGGCDLTPYYVFPADAKHFHSRLKAAMDPFGENWYPKCKQHCDEYFINKHRNNEARGIGGVFYDYLRPESTEDADKLLAFQKANGDAFLDAYLPIVQERMKMEYSEMESWWQEIRRGRYVEFNLIHDRGTLFGLKTNGRTESILMSLPPRARWEYDYHPEPGTWEAETVEMLKPRDWVNYYVEG